MPILSFLQAIPKWSNSEVCEMINHNKDMNDYKTFVIAEIGCNHKGDMETAKELIKIAKIFCMLML
jgi:hypothetical protein